MILLLPSILFIAATPDYAAFQARLDDYARLVITSKSCSQIGIHFNEDDVRQYGSWLATEGIRMDIPVDEMVPLFKKALDDERREFDSRAEQVDEHDQTSVEKYANWWADRCLDLALDPRYKHMARIDSLPE